MRKSSKSDPVCSWPAHPRHFWRLNWMSSSCVGCGESIRWPKPLVERFYSSLFLLLCEFVISFLFRNEATLSNFPIQISFLCSCANGYDGSLMTAINIVSLFLTVNTKAGLFTASFPTDAILPKPFQRGYRRIDYRHYLLHL